MKRNKPFYQGFLLLGVALYWVACSKQDDMVPSSIVIAPPPDFGYKVVGYFPSYRNPASVPDVKFRMTNVVNYAFFSVTSTGSLTVNSPSTLTAVIAKARANNAKIFMSVSGTASDFKAATTTANGRNTLIKNIMISGNMY